MMDFMTRYAPVSWVFSGLFTLLVLSIVYWLRSHLRLRAVTARLERERKAQDVPHPGFLLPDGVVSVLPNRYDGFVMPAGEPITGHGNKVVSSFYVPDMDLNRIEGGVKPGDYVHYEHGSDTVTVNGEERRYLKEAK